MTHHSVWGGERSYEATRALPGPSLCCPPEHGHRKTSRRRRIVWATGQAVHCKSFSSSCTWRSKHGRREREAAGTDWDQSDLMPDCSRPASAAYGARRTVVQADALECLEWICARTHASTQQTPRAREWRHAQTDKRVKQRCTTNQAHSGALARTAADERTVDVVQREDRA